MWLPFFLFPKWGVLPSLCRDGLCTAWHTAEPLQEWLSSREKSPLLLPSWSFRETLTLRSAGSFYALQPVLRKEGFPAFALFIMGKKMISICEVTSHVLWRGKRAGNLGKFYRCSLNCNRLGSWPCFSSALENRTLNIFIKDVFATFLLCTSST